MLLNYWIRKVLGEKVKCIVQLLVLIQCVNSMQLTSLSILILYSLGSNELFCFCFSCYATEKEVSFCLSCYATKKEVTFHSSSYEQNSYNFKNKSANK